MNATMTESNSPEITMSDVSASDKHCVFRSGSSWFSVPAVTVREVAIMPALVRVPSCDPSLLGICHLRSEFVPVIAVNSLLDVDFEQASQPHDKLIVIRGTGGNGVGAWALRIAETAALESLETLGSPESRSDDANLTPVIGTAMFRDQIVRVLDPTSLYALTSAAGSRRSLSGTRQPLRHARCEQPDTEGSYIDDSNALPCNACRRRHRDCNTFHHRVPSGILFVYFRCRCAIDHDRGWHVMVFGMRLRAGLSMLEAVVSDSETSATRVTGLSEFDHAATIIGTHAARWETVAASSREQSSEFKSMMLILNRRGASTESSSAHLRELLAGLGNSLHSHLTQINRRNSEIEQVSQAIAEARMHRATPSSRRLATSNSWRPQLTRFQTIRLRRKTRSRTILSLRRRRLRWSAN